MGIETEFPLKTKVQTPVGEGMIVALSAVGVGRCHNYTVELKKPHKGSILWHANSLELEQQIKAV